MRIYISGPITGHENDYMERFAKAEIKLSEQGYSVVNPAKTNATLPTDTTYEEYMKIAFALLDTCDSIYMLSGWRTSCGANREYGYTLGTDKGILMETESGIARNALQQKEQILNQR